MTRVRRRFWLWVLIGWNIEAIRSWSRRRKERKRRKAEASRPRLSQTCRSRSLTADFSQGQNIQSQSVLFAVLPLEIRLHVYEWALGGRTVHFRRSCVRAAPERVVPQPYWCKAKGVQDHSTRFIDDLTMDVYCEFGVPPYKHAPSPALLRTCRRMYDSDAFVKYGNDD